MLPGSNCVRVADLYRFTGQDRPDDVRDQPVVSPVATTDDIAGTGRGHGNTMPLVIFWIEVGGAIGGRHQFRTPLAVGIRVIPPHRLVFPVSPDPLPVFVHLVSSDINHRLDRPAGSYRLQKMHGPHDVGCIGLHRNLVGVSYQRLGRHVNDDLRSCSQHLCFKPLRIPHIGDDRMHQLPDMCHFEKARTRRRLQSIPGNFRSQAMKPEGKPGAFETGMTGEKGLFSLPEICRCHLLVFHPLFAVCYHTFHGALPLVQSSSSCCLSRRVSIGCQNPLCLNAASWPSWASPVSGSFSNTVMSPVIRSSTAGSSTMKPPLIQAPSPAGFSLNEVT